MKYIPLKKMKGNNILTERLKILQNMEMVTSNIKVMEEKLDKKQNGKAC